MKQTSGWYSGRTGTHLGMARWGNPSGIPVLVLPTAGGDAQEIEREGLVGHCWDLIESGQITMYCVDSVAGAAIMSHQGSPEHQMWLLNQFQEAVAREVVPAIRDDFGPDTEVLVAGASIGAYLSLGLLCRYPALFRSAIAMSGTYRIHRLLGGEYTHDLYMATALDFVPEISGPQLETLRTRSVVMPCGEGAWENIGETWSAADVLGCAGVPNRVVSWGPDWVHDWPTWWEMLPLYLREALDG